MQNTLNNMKETQETYNRAKNAFMSHLLFRYIRCGDIDTFREGFLHERKEMPIGCVIIPYAIKNPMEWYVGWYRGRDDKGAYLIESIETHKICRFYNCAYLYSNDKDFTDNQWYRYSDREYKLIDIIRNRVSKHSTWFVVGAPTFHENGSIDVPIREKFSDDFLTKTYRNMRSMTIKALGEQCEELSEMNKKAMESK